LNSDLLRLSDELGLASRICFLRGALEAPLKGSERGERGYVWSAHLLGTVAGEITVTEVIDEDEHGVGFGGGRCRNDRGGEQGEKNGMETVLYSGC
jgi:hypothetical protein